MTPTGAVAIAGLAVATVYTGGAAAVACGAALSGAIAGGASGAVIGAVGGGISGGWRGALDGACSGFMSGTLRDFRSQNVDAETSKQRKNEVSRHHGGQFPTLAALTYPV